MKLLGNRGGQNVRSDAEECGRLSLSCGQAEVLFLHTHTQKRCIPVFGCPGSRNLVGNIFMLLVYKPTEKLCAWFSPINKYIYYHIVEQPSY